MRGMKRPESGERQMKRMATLGRHELMIRRSANKNVHVITPHGRVQAGRKGRRG
ncbi:MAG TPA: hypothetical protein VL949_02160 [Geobacteraceae bacterium]|nr:hypothetical protein [Geobacteraceae bacterium]